MPLMTACLQGVCGTCLTPVLAGQPDHRDAYLSAEEKAAKEAGIERTIKNMVTMTVDTTCQAWIYLKAIFQILQR